MTRIFVCSDHHFNHANILNFKRSDGSPLRVFKDKDHMNWEIVRLHNELVLPQDHVYFLGDVAINKGGFEMVKAMNGHKRLIRGNHDIFKTKEYIEIGFEEIYGCRVWPKHNMIFTHIPLHPNCLRDRKWINFHGHLHANLVLDANGHPDENYRNVCLEHTDYKPVLLME